jgi:Protein of unknown function (DUF3465)
VGLAVRAARLRGPLIAALLALGAAGCAEGTADNGSFEAALAAGRPAEVTVQGRVTGVLPDTPDRGDGPHQRFDLDVDGTRVEIDHNLALAPRAPVAPGSAVLVHGQFEPDPGRPVIHYTHHATGRHEGGWIELGGRRYQ